MKLFAIISGVVGLVLVCILTGVNQKAVGMYEHWKYRDSVEWQRSVESHGGNAISAIIVDDGIDKFEAYAAAGDYFFRYVNGCGFPYEIREKEECWEVFTVEGIAGEEGPIVKIKKNTGDIFCEGYQNSSISELKLNTEPVAGGDATRWRS